MKKLLLTILVICPLLGGNAYSNSHCTNERQDWIVWIKKEIVKELENVKFSNNSCWVEIISDERQKLKQKSNITKKTFKPETKNKTLINLVYSILKSDDTPKDINYVPKDFKKETQEIKTYLAEVIK
jgi:hypothetical protein|tara:strand:- start:49 stop:429 length:381 start_codon:yes stop_codon:yes gene_type:complete